MANHTLTYSHGGGDEGMTIAIPGTSTGRGRTISIVPAADCVPLIVKNIGSGNVTFRIVFNGTTLVNNTYNPDPAFWINANAAGDIVLTPGQGDAYSLRTQIPYWATEITAVAAGGNLVSFVSFEFERTRKWIRAKYPDAESVQSEF